MINWKSLSKKIPDKIQIGSKEYYDILWFSKDSSRDHIGLTDYEKKQLHIQLDLSPKETTLTYLHEVLHAISAKYEVNLTENQVLKLEKAIPYLLKKNNVFRE